MSSGEVHLAAASENARLAEMLYDRDPLTPWLPTAIYYTIVQCMERSAFLAGGRHLTSTPLRRSFLKDSLEASASFGSLKDLSEHWRYDGRRPERDELSSATAWADSILTFLRQSWPGASGFLERPYSAR